MFSGKLKTKTLSVSNEKTSFWHQKIDNNNQQQSHGMEVQPLVRNVVDHEKMSNAQINRRRAMHQRRRRRQSIIKTDEGQPLIVSQQIPLNDGNGTIANEDGDSSRRDDSYDQVQSNQSQSIHLGAATDSRGQVEDTEISVADRSVVGETTIPLNGGNDESNRQNRRDTSEGSHKIKRRKNSRQSEAESQVSTHSEDTPTSSLKDMKLRRRRARANSQRRQRSNGSLGEVKMISHETESMDQVQDQSIPLSRASTAIPLNDSLKDTVIHLTGSDHETSLHRRHDTNDKPRRGPSTSLTGSSRMTTQQGEDTSHDNVEGKLIPLSGGLVATDTIIALKGGESDEASQHRRKGRRQRSNNDIRDVRDKIDQINDDMCKSGTSSRLGDESEAESCGSSLALNSSFGSSLMEGFSMNSSQESEKLHYDVRDFIRRLLLHETLHPKVEEDPTEMASPRNFFFVTRRGRSWNYVIDSPAGHGAEEQMTLVPAVGIPEDDENLNTQLRALRYRKAKLKSATKFIMLKQSLDGLKGSKGKEGFGARLDKSIRKIRKAIHVDVEMVSLSDWTDDDDEEEEWIPMFAPLDNAPPPVVELDNDEAARLLTIRRQHRRASFDRTMNAANSNSLFSGGGAIAATMNVIGKAAAELEEGMEHLVDETKLVAQKGKSIAKLFPFRKLRSRWKMGDSSSDFSGESTTSK